MYNIKQNEQDGPESGMKDQNTVQVSKPIREGLKKKQKQEHTYADTAVQQCITRISHEPLMVIVHTRMAYFQFTSLQSPQGSSL
jgi:preprotein translocase subunit SecF